jgi:hypothetical protein
VVLSFLVPVRLVAMDQWGVVVLVQVIPRPMLELAEQATGVMVGHVVVVVGVDDRRVRVRVLFVTDNPLDRLCLLHAGPPWLADG